MEWFEENLFQKQGQDFLKEFDLPKILPRLFVAALILISFNFLKLNIFSHQEYLTTAESYATLKISTNAPRGLIYDRYGHLIASNKPSFDLFVDLNHLTPAKANLLNEIVGQYHLDVQKIYDSSVVVKSLPRQSALKILTLYPNDLSFRILDSYERVYLGGNGFGNLVGYLGFPNKTEMKEFDVGPDELIGKTGIEQAYQNFLRPQPGAVEFERDALNDVVRLVKKKEAQPGYNLVTSIDEPFQQKAYALIKNYIAQIGVKKAVFIAMDPNTGGIISMISFPNFDSEVFVSGRSGVGKLLTDPDQPLFDRAISGLYAPGSVVKPITACGALTEHIISPDKKIWAPGYLKIPNPYFPGQYTIYKDWNTFGWVDMEQAIANSVDVYFYTIGGGAGNQPGLGIERVKKYYELFGLGQPTGVDLLDEGKGFLPDPTTKKEMHPLNPTWYLGDTYNVSIGQGDMLTTPLQIANFTSALATNNLYQPFVVKDILSPTSSQVVYRRQPRLIRSNLINPQYLKIVQAGMRMTVTAGSATTLADAIVPIAGKSGTPQILNNSKLNAIFTGYAPYRKPKIEMTLLFEETPSGSGLSLPLYKELMNAYFTMHPASATSTP
ncbi:MAG: penicillin-binding transpeptidase domain-containing protein [Patescibacteria group bacterium]|nr:penicillin-binding transpeptidase domain-containing protein [Patescibacteria group bacterium]